MLITQTCLKRPWKGASCQKKTGFVEKLCVPAPCPPTPTASSMKCGPCAEPKTRKNECGCDIVECKPKQTVNECGKDGKCPECSKCVFTPYDKDKCPNEGVKTCERLRKLMFIYSYNSAC